LLRTDALSTSRIEYTTVSRRDLSAHSWWLPSNSVELGAKPLDRRAAGEIEEVRAEFNCDSPPNSSKAWPSINSFVSAFTPLRRADDTYHVGLATAEIVQHQGDAVGPLLQRRQRAGRHSSVIDPLSITSSIATPPVGCASLSNLRRH
jgi:hypothetical protein